MKVYKLFINNLKEEAWINEMAKSGWLIDKIGFGYTFKKQDTQIETLKMDYRVFSKKEDFEAYVSLFEDFGWKHIAGSRRSGAQYFIHENPNAEEDIFSDEASQAARVKRMRSQLRQSMAVLLVNFSVLLTQSWFSISTLLHPSELYLTPGIWDKTGSSFWSAFLFETPFALLRAIFMYALPVLITIYIIYSYKIQVDYNRQIKA
ncbi:MULTISPECIES: DUF2812 domain-containing protein [unclassified Fusibacter]|uniref:DUF2812 domain-containing protein n=1 Tax=unclassified Fusibacter TaxID=2624464 RepID=UPI0010124CE1|nr:MULTISPECIES: DUF2812 domain-containing protein [unclassified Fusibacter]MCK8059357.1 DUF2812 domain-containing protein [Fusibacter sp. A2]NPE21179.1 DUF2812 domain-containing protein [Fusibacter sp. A1]RXV62447.1 DUF2812 domain-containing protein [Fusibacter sp. A1]